MTLEEAKKIILENGLQSEVDKLTSLRKPVVISRDNILVEAGEKRGLGYNDAFQFYRRNRRKAQAEVDGVLTQKAIDARKNGQDVIIDMTNMTRKGRRRWCHEFSKYHKTAKMFATGYEVIKERCERRGKLTGKCISEGILVQMCKNFTLPMFSEGFDSISYRWDKG